MPLRFAVMAALAVAIFVLAVTAPGGPPTSARADSPAFKVNAVLGPAAAVTHRGG